MSIPDYLTIETNDALGLGKESRNSTLKYIDDAPINQVGGLNFGRLYQIKNGTVQNLAVADVGLINRSQSLRVALYDTDSSTVELGIHNDKGTASLGKVGFYTCESEEVLVVGEQIRVRLLPHASDPLRLAIGRVCKTADTGKTAIITGAYIKSGTLAPTGRVSEIYFSDFLTLVMD